MKAKIFGKLMMMNLRGDDRTEVQTKRIDCIVRSKIQELFGQELNVPRVPKV